MATRSTSGEVDRDISPRFRFRDGNCACFPGRALAWLGVDLCAFQNVFMYRYLLLGGFVFYSGRDVSHRFNYFERSIPLSRTVSSDPGR